ncbi:MAG: kinase/pyrophosphorylase [Atopobiaceae bacterium]|jgi:regulator of PEP synthase PpsR (kinase-PPPase family)|nr:kinase/pyrophosphorylase [Atopobiaceae bacterium]
MASLDLSTDEVVEDIKPIVLVISDARGDTAYSVVVAAAAQYEVDALDISRLSDATSVKQVEEFLDQQEQGRPMAVFHTFVDERLRRDVRHELVRRGIPSIDLLGPAVTVLSTLTGEEPSNAVGALRDRLSSNVD